MNFGKWDPSIHEDLEQIKRISSAQKISASKITLNQNSKSCLISGSAEIPYEVTLSNCTCADFVIRQLPCKHIYRLALELGLLDDIPKFNKKTAASFNVSAEIERFFSLYKSGAITGEKFVKIAEALKKGK